MTPASRPIMREKGRPACREFRLHHHQTGSAVAYSSPSHRRYRRQRSAARSQPVHFDFPHPDAAALAHCRGRYASGLQGPTQASRATAAWVRSRQRLGSSLINSMCYIRSNALNCWARSRASDWSYLRLPAVLPQAGNPGHQPQRLWRSAARPRQGRQQPTRCSMR